MSGRRNPVEPFQLDTDDVTEERARALVSTILIGHCLAAASGFLCGALFITWVLR